jgi:hypothetical protein
MSDEILVFNTEQNRPSIYQSPSKNKTDMNIIESLQYFENIVDKNVTGWFYGFDNIIIHNILKSVQKDITGDVCEIGVAFGKSAVAISNYKRPEDKFYLYEIFDEEMKQKAEDNIRTYGTFENVEWRIENSTELTTDTVQFDTPLRLLHIDGCHEHYAVFSDLTLFTQKMAKDGAIVLDDFNDPEYPGVNSGCLEFIYKNKDWTLFAIGQNKAYLCRKEFHNFYVLSLVEQLDKDNKLGIPNTLSLRQMFDTNVLLCCSRQSWKKEDIVKLLNEELRTL